MSEIDDKTLKMTARRFPTQNVILYNGGQEPQGVKVSRDVNKHKVTVIIGKYNVTIMKAVPIEEEKE